jgi:hypothetical protein
MMPTNPFNPGSPVDPNDFVGRIREIGSFEEKLRQTADGSLSSMAITGGYGIGKTSFLQKCKFIAEEKGALTVYFSINEMDSLNRNTLARMLIQKLKEKVEEEILLERIKNVALDSLKRIKVRIPSGVEISYLNAESDVVYPNLNAALTAAWKLFKNEKIAVVFLIDEARILEKNKADLILYLRAVLEQLQVDKTPIMFLLGGMFTINATSGSGFSPLIRTFPPSFLENFNKEESKAFIKKKLATTRIKINESILDTIYEITQGHPFILTAYMGSLYSKLIDGEKEISIKHIEATNIDFVKVSLYPFFSRFYDNASPGSKKVLKKIAMNDGEAQLTELADSMKQETYRISPYLAKLTQDGAIVKEERGHYKLFHKLFGQYILESPEVRRFGAQ